MMVVAEAPPATRVCSRPSKQASPIVDGQSQIAKIEGIPPAFSMESSAEWHGDCRSDRLISSACIRTSLHARPGGRRRTFNHSAMLALACGRHEFLALSPVRARSLAAAADAERVSACRRQICSSSTHSMSDAVALRGSNTLEPWR